jgi:DNA-binding response OmpR family regulator
MTGIAANRKVLIVDDEVKIAETLGLVFSTRGFEVKVAYTAENAAEIAAAWQPDVAIVDVILPGMNGIEFTRVLTGIYPECSVVLFSGDPHTSELLEKASAEGRTYDILAKPLHPTLILATVSELLLAGPHGHA